MFPLLENTIFFLTVLAVGAFMAVLTIRRGWIGQRSTLTLLLVGIAWPWPIAAAFGLGINTQLMALYLSVWSMVALLAGLAFGLVALRLQIGMIASIAIVCMPFVAGSAYVLERQRVPNAVCQDHVVFRLNDLRLEVPRELGVFSAGLSIESSQAWEGTYNASTGSKPDVRALCRLAENGRKPVEVAHLWLSFESFERELQAACKGSVVAFPLEEACVARARTTPTVTQFYAYSVDFDIRSNGYFDERFIENALSQGKLEGQRCEDSLVGPDTRYCTVWFQLNSEVLIVSIAKLGAAQQGEDPLGDTKILVGALVQRLDPS